MVIVRDLWALVLDLTYSTPFPCAGGGLGRHAKGQVRGQIKKMVTKQLLCQPCRFPSFASAGSLLPAGLSYRHRSIKHHKIQRQCAGGGSAVPGEVEAAERGDLSDDFWPHPNWVKVSKWQETVAPTSLLTHLTHKESWTHPIIPMVKTDFLRKQTHPVNFPFSLSAFFLH